MLQLTDFIVVKEFLNKEGEYVKALDFDNSVKYNEVIIARLLEEGTKFISVKEEEYEEGNTGKI